MKKILGFLSLCLILFACLSNVSFAQTELLFGQDHSYSVVFRGNGEAIVYAKLVINNPNDKPITEFTFEIPQVSPSEFVTYQQKLPRQCFRYAENNSTKPCAEYRDPDYSRGYYYGNQYGNNPIEYQKIQYTKSGNVYHLTLPYAIEPYKSGAVIISYATMGYVKDSAGLYKFNFETLKVPSRIADIRVAIDVDSDLQLKGKKSQVNYGMSARAPALSTNDSVSSPELDKTVSQIGSYGAITKTAKNLSPNESFSVKGEYAKSWGRLYLSSIILSILIIAGIFAIIYFISRFFRKKNRDEIIISTNSNINTPINIGLAKHKALSMLNLALGLLSAVLVVGLSYLLVFVEESNFLGSIGYDPLLALSVFIAIIILYLLSALGPAILAASKDGWRALLFVLLTEFLWLLIFVIIYIILFRNGIKPNYYGGNVVF